MKRSRLFASTALAAASMLLATACPVEGGGGTGPTNQPATVVVNGTPNSGTAPLNVAFSSGGTFDPEGTAITYAWDFGGGAPASTAQNPSVTFRSAGTYVVRLTVRDAKGLADPTPAQITVRVVRDD